MKDPDLMNLSRAETPVVLVCSKNWKSRAKSKKEGITSSIADVVGGEIAQWVMPSNKFKLRSQIDQFFEVNELKGRVVIESDVIASLVRSVVDEIGLALFPLLYISKEVREKTLRILGPKNGYWKYRVWLACNHQSHQDPFIQAFARSFDEVGAVIEYS